MLGGIPFDCAQGRLSLRLKNGSAQDDAGQIGGEISNRTEFAASKRKSVLDFSVQDASAALPQNCQTTSWILRGPLFCVNVTLVIRFAGSYSRG